MAQKGVEAGLFGWDSAALLLGGGHPEALRDHGGCAGISLFSTVYSLIHQWFIFGFLPVIIVYKVFTELMAYAKLARNYRWMRMVYSTGSRNILDPINYADQPDFQPQAGQAAL